MKPAKVKAKPVAVKRHTDTTRAKPLAQQVSPRRDYSPQVKKVPKAPKFKLGKLPAKHDARTPYLTEFLHRPKLPAPAPFDYLAGAPTDLGMLGNDTAGDCTCAGIFHMLQVQAIVAGGTVPSNDELAAASIDLYKKITLEVNGVAYDPNDPSTDTGLALLDVLNYCRQAGLIGAFVKIRHQDVAEIEVGGRLFGGLYTGAMLPSDAQGQLQAGQPWSPTSGAGGEPGSWGGHCMYIGAADGQDPTYVTWGQRQKALYSWISKYSDEMYVIIDNAWVTGTKPAPSGFDMDKLRSFLAAL